MRERVALVVFAPLFAEARRVLAHCKPIGFSGDRTISKAPFPHWRRKLGESICLIVQTGVGPARAKEAATWTFDNFETSQAFVLGYGGGLAPDLVAGDVIFASEVHSTNGRPALRTNCNPDIKGPLLISLARKSVRVLKGAIVTSDCLLTTVEGKRQLFSETGALAVDMESYAICAAAADRAIAGMAMRAVIDDAKTPLPEPVARMVNERGDAKSLLQCAGVLVRSPSAVKSLFFMPGQIRKANRSMDVLLASLAELL